MLSAFILLLVACGGGTQIADTPSPEAKVEVEPSPTKESPKLQPTKQPTPLVTPTNAPLTSVPIPLPTETPTPVSPATATNVLSTPTTVPDRTAVQVPVVLAAAVTAIDCTIIQTPVLSATCSTNAETPSNREWDSNGTGGRGRDAVWTFPIETLVSVLHVQVGFCDERGAPCRVLEASFDLPVRIGMFGIPCESDKDPVFTENLTDLSRIQLISPPGGLSGNTIAQHSYIFMAQGGTERGTPVYAPTESKLVSMSWYKGPQDPKAYYLLSFQLTCEVSIKSGSYSRLV